MEVTATLAFRRLSSESTVTTCLVPVQPSGWPMALFRMRVREGMILSRTRKNGEIKGRHSHCSPSNIDLVDI